jgi:hypothetical protein
VRSIYADWERGDYSHTGWAHPDIEFVIADLPDLGSWRAVAGMTEGWPDFLSAWEGHRAEVEEYRELDDEARPSAWRGWWTRQARAERTS